MYPPTSSGLVEELALKTISFTTQLADSYSEFVSYLFSIGKQGRWAENFVLPRMAVFGCLW